MRYNIISYLIGEGFRNALKNKKSTMISITTMCLTMFLFGGFFIFGENINHIVSNLEKEQGMQVFLDYGVTDEETKNAEQKIREIEGVNTVTYVSSADAHNSMKETLKNQFVEEMSDDWFQSGFTVTLTDLSLNETVKSQIYKIEKVVGIEAADSTIATLESIAKGLKIGILVILVALIIISIFIISNTIKLSVHARRKEISIMKYVGATNSFIRWPFIVEGIIIGIIAAFVTIILIGFGYDALAVKAVQAPIFQRLSYISLVPFADMIKLIMILYLGIGIGIGVFGSSMSMRKYLDA